MYFLTIVLIVIIAFILKIGKTCIICFKEYFQLIPVIFFTDIFEDPLQVLYKKCSKKLCSAPVCLLSNSSKQSYSGEPGEKIYCSLHQELPALNDDLTSVMDDIKRSVTQLFEAMSYYNLQHWNFWRDGLGAKTKSWGSALA